VANTLFAQLHLRRANGFVLDVELEAPPGVTVLFGPSGAGKSTLLRALSGLERPSAGRLRLGDEVWLDTETAFERPVERRGLGYVFQSLALFPHLTVAENVLFAIDRRLPMAIRREEAERQLRHVKVGQHLSSRRPASLSGGEAQRVALARAFARRPRLLLLDEPLSALDGPLRRELGLLVRGYADEAAIPLLYVTHQLDEAQTLGDRAIQLEAGRVVRRGRADEILPIVAS
jgi:molybdate transport system ATP-binding protein